MDPPFAAIKDKNLVRSLYPYSLFFNASLFYEQRRLTFLISKLELKVKIIFQLNYILPTFSNVFLENALTELTCLMDVDELPLVVALITDPN